MRPRGALRRCGIAAGLLLGLVGVLASAGCVPEAEGGGQRYMIAGGGAAGVYYGYGEQLADALHDDLGLDVGVAKTHGSVDNLLRVGSGEALLGFSQGDTAADALAGTGGFDEPLPVRAVARVYDEYVHVVVPADSDVQSISDLAGRRVSLGARNSGVHVIATRVFEASGVPLETVDNPALGLDASIDAMERGELDGFFWVGGLPTPGIEQLRKATPIRLLPIESDLVERINDGHAGVYQLADFPLGVYGTGEATETMTVPNYLITSESAPDGLIHDVLRVLFDSRSTIARTVPAAEYLDRRQAIFTAPIELHPGAAEYYVESRR